MVVYFPNDKTPEEWREEVKRCYRQEQESWERSDSDGFLSQWASTQSARIYNLCAEVAENGNKWEFEVLADAFGNEIEGVTDLKTRYGWVLRLPDGRIFKPSSAKDEKLRRKRDAAKGFQFVRVTKPAVVVSRSEKGGFHLLVSVEPRMNVVKENRDGKNIDSDTSTN